jgi:uncharacterized protein (DUF1330 family)
MAAYLVVEHKITDPDKFKEYGSKVLPLIAKQGGRLLTRGGTHKVLETEHCLPDRVVIFEFPDRATLDAWYSSPEYQPLIALFVFGWRTALTVCQPISMAITVVLPAPVASFNARRISSGLAPSLAPRTCDQNFSNRLPSFGATSVSQMIVSIASTW